MCVVIQNVVSQIRSKISWCACFKYEKYFQIRENICSSRVNSRQEERERTTYAQKKKKKKKKKDEIGSRLETPPRKYLFGFAQKTGVSASAGTATKLLHLHIYKAPWVDKLYETDR